MYRSITFCLSKRVYCSIVVALLFVIFYAINTKHENVFETLSIVTQMSENRERNSLNEHTGFIKFQRVIEKSFREKINDMKYVLVWSNARHTPLVYLGDGQTVFMNKSCTRTNCYVTSDRNLLGDYTEFDAIVFNGPELNHIRYINDLPKRRHPHQKYVYANIEAAATYPVCSEFWNNFFNLTWSYRTDSDIYWPYFSIRDSMKNIIGPQKDMNWMREREMNSIDEDLKISLSYKTKAVAWFASNCETQSQREQFVEELQERMKLYGLKIDIFGKCGTLLQCPRTIMSRCHRMLEKHYYFYLAFENSISEDYVTEKLLHGLLHNTVPIVLGRGDYSRFMPKGSYLNALELGAMNLARKINELIQNPIAYYEFFKWRKYYSYHYTHESPETDVYCRFCEYLNNDVLMKKKSVYEHFNRWWTPTRFCKDVVHVERH